jgi:hypothetical protein
MSKNGYTMIYQLVDGIGSPIFRQSVAPWESFSRGAYATPSGVGGCLHRRVFVMCFLLWHDECHKWILTVTNWCLRKAFSLKRSWTSLHQHLRDLWSILLHPEKMHMFMTICQMVILWSVTGMIYDSSAEYHIFVIRIGSKLTEG